MLSLLGRQYLLTGPKFMELHPHPWLVWEPGEWIAPTTGEKQNTSETLLPSSRIHERPKSGDALCFELRPKPGVDVTIGRAEENNIVINDMTVSRVHVKLAWEAGAWRAEVLSDPQKATIAGAVVKAGERIALKSGTPVRLGGIQLTYLDAAHFLERLKPIAEKLKPG